MKGRRGRKGPTVSASSVFSLLRHHGPFFFQRQNEKELVAVWLGFAADHASMNFHDVANEMKSMPTPFFPAG